MDAESSSYLLLYCIIHGTVGHFCYSYSKFKVPDKLLKLMALCHSLWVSIYISDSHKTIEQILRGKS